MIPLTTLRVRWYARDWTTANYSVWRHDAKHRPLQRVQNSHARVVSLAPYRSFASRFRRHLHWLLVQERILLNCDVKSQSAHPSPTWLALKLIAEYLPAYNLRSADNSLLVIPRTKTKIVSRAFKVSAPTIWISDPLSRRCTTITYSFRSQLNHICFAACTVYH